MNTSDHFFRGKDFGHIPSIRAAHIHKFNKAQNDAAAFEVFGHGNDLMIIRPLFHNHIDFNVLKASFLCGVNTIQHISHWKINIVHLFKDRVIQAIKTYRQSL